ncbi:MAG: type II toxin-antitoxin system HipA family toxin [Acidimicrobiales bacterium]
MSYTPAELVEVRAWGRTIGAVAPDPRSGFYAFEYEPGWADRGQPLSPLQMPNGPGTFVFPDLDPLTFQRLPAMLADCLPDRFGNALVNAWMAEQGVSPADITPLDRLAYAGDRAMGALEFHPPAGSPAAGATALQLADLVTAARAAIAGDLRQTPEDALHELIQVGTSAGGARAKAVVAYNPSTGQIRSGQLDAPAGFEHWMIKLDGVNNDPTREADPFTTGAGFGRIEFAYHRMAVAAGIAMAHCELLLEGPRAHFLTRRFDRDDDGRRIHMQTLCGLAGLDFNMAGAHSYAQYLDVIDQLGLGPDAREQAFRRIVFNVAAVNRDDHTKNLAFVLPEDGDWSLAPAYDLTHAHNPSGEWTNQHQMSLNGKRIGVGLDDLHQFGDRFRVPGYRQVVREVIAAVDRWAEFADEAGLAEHHLTRITADLADARPR